MKQVILVRKDLRMPAGKMAAQCCHASVECVLKSMPRIVEQWHHEGMMKIVLGVEDRQHLEMKLRAAKREKIVAALITDAGKTFFTEPTVTCLGIGPSADETIDKVTGDLQPL